MPFLETSGKNNGKKLTIKGIKRVVECLDQFLERFSTQNLLYKQGAIKMMFVNLFKSQNWLVWNSSLKFQSLQL